MTRNTPGERWYQRLLRLYPRDFRDEFGGEMTQLYRDRGREERWWNLWYSLVVDLLRTAPSEHLSMLRQDTRRSPRNCESAGRRERPNQTQQDAAACPCHSFPQDEPHHISACSAIATLPFDVPAHDPVTFATVGAVVALVASMACSIPAARAVRIDPTMAMRTE